MAARIGAKISANNTIHRIPDYLAKRMVRNPRDIRPGFDSAERPQKRILLGGRGNRCTIDIAAGNTRGTSNSLCGRVRNPANRMHI
jgi:hypothetical protein